MLAMEVFSFFLKRTMDGGFMSDCMVKGRSEKRGLDFSFVVC